MSINLVQCPMCHKPTVKYVDKVAWICKHCKLRFAVKEAGFKMHNPNDENPSIGEFKVVINLTEGEEPDEP